MQLKLQKRRFDLDWWRVIAIALVYLHHVGMPFNGDDFHIMNNTSSKVLDDVMVFFEQFRLPLLFLISGAGTAYAFSNRRWSQFLKERSRRLLIPLVFGVFIIVPPQTYYEHIDVHHSYGTFYRHILDHLNVNHLWFIENLFYISVICIPLILFLKSSRSIGFKSLLVRIGHFKVGMFTWVLPLLFLKLISKVYFPEDSKDILNLSSTLFYGFFFVAGLVMASTPELWDCLKKYRKRNALVMLVTVLTFYGYYFLPSSIASKFFSIPTRWNLWYTVSTLLGWTFVITALGYGQVWFNKESRLLRLLNEGIYPFYILHQTVLVIFGYYIIALNTSIPLKIGLLIGTSLPVILLLYRYCIYPFRIPRVLFGMKNNR